ncbi:MAG: amino acid permease [Chloroherpetonaceae bacterium]|nr:amino acid permease [Chloroherpetonaceae bacterium]
MASSSSDSTPPFFQSLLQKKIIAPPEKHGENSLNRVLTTFDLTSLGVAAIIGAGIFSTIGNASFNGGPAISILFIVMAIACVFTALCYAQFASTVPVSGSAYTYAYVSLGEMTAWMIGWALILEYAVSNMVVAISWSEYFTSMLSGFGLHVPEYLAMDFGTASKSFADVQAALASGKPLSDFPSSVLTAAKAYESAPSFLGLKFIADFPALLIVLLITALVYVGIKESRTASNALVVFKVGVIIFVIVAGVFFVTPENWTPFAPNGVGGVLSGVAAVFFAFIGFDSVSTTAEECKDPQRDLPKAMIYSLIICTVLYVAITMVLTGMVPYKELGVSDPLAYVFAKVGMHFISGVIAVSAVVAITSAILVYQLGQPRIWMAMSRDGLLPKIFSRIHPKYKTPDFSTILTGFLVGVPALFLNMQVVTDLTSVGTFFAFILVCGGVLVLDPEGKNTAAKFRVPYVNGQVIIPVLLVLSLAVAFTQMEGYTASFFEKPQQLIFWIVFFGLAVQSVRLRLSLIPQLGILVNLFLMTELGVENWIRFLVWVGVGLVIYFGYGYRNSKLRNESSGKS